MTIINFKRVWDDEEFSRNRFPQSYVSYIIIHDGNQTGYHQNPSVCLMGWSEREINTITTCGGWIGGQTLCEGWSPGSNVVGWHHAKATPPPHNSRKWINMPSIQQQRGKIPATSIVPYLAARVEEGRATPCGRVCHFFTPSSFSPRCCFHSLWLCSAIRNKLSL